MPAVIDPTADAALLELLTTPEGRADPYPLYRRIRERSPVATDEVPRRPSLTLRGVTSLPVRLGEPSAGCPQRLPPGAL
jgi:hypothetical protein